MTDFLTAAWALTDSVLVRTFALTAVLVGLAMLAAACIAHRHDTAPTEPVDRLISGDYWAAEFNTDREHA